jgi:uncharacterized membrane protein
MESKAKLFGHPIHPMLITFPIGLFVTSVIFDIIYLLSSNTSWTQASFYMIGAGAIGGLLAAVFGLIDWLAVPSGTRAKAIGLWHGIGNVVVTALFVVSWFIRRDNPATPDTIAIILSIVGVLLATVTAWLGGELVDRLAVGVDRGAHLDSPNSLTGRPASENSAGYDAARGNIGQESR